ADDHAAEPLRLVRTIALGNVEGRIDHMAADDDCRRLFVAALGNNSVEVINLSTGRVDGSIRGLHEPQGVALVNDEELLAVCDGGDGTCRLFDARSFHSKKAFDFRSDADNVRYDASERRLYVGFGDGAIGVVDTARMTKIAEVALPAHPESFQLETKGHRIFVNVPSARQIAVVDRTQLKLVATWPVNEAHANFPMALDETRHQLYVGCRSPAIVLVYDTESGKCVAAFPTVGDTDDLFYDRPTRRLYVCGGNGFVFVYQLEDTNHFTCIARIPTASGARTALFVPRTARLFVAVPHRGSQAAIVKEYEVMP
ncbi:MAG TPA: WD40 repeat domain-containing protein, partial [Lacipirellulaceae bacterium]|nr:WD40 repeat domain-containing protein [Lacipirellulaceae bacterium]